MKSINSHTVAPLIRVRSGDTISSENGTFYLGPYADIDHVVTASGMVKGNRKSPNPWSFHVTRTVHGRIDAWYRYHSAPRFFTDTYTGSYTSLPSVYPLTEINSAVQTAEAAALTQLLERIRSSDLDLSIDAFQAKQTAALGADCAKVTKKLAMLYKARGPALLTAPMKAFGSAWLMFQYGIKPTLSSIYDTVKFTRSHYNNELRVYEGRGSCPISVKVPVTSWPDYTFEPCTALIEGNARSLMKVRMRIPDDTITQAARLTSLNPASIAWELVPFSFVADWFLNIGDYLRGVETSCIFDRYFVDGFGTSSFIVETNVKAFRSASQPTYSWGGVCSASSVDKHSSRVLLTELPSPPFPKFRPTLGSSRLLSAASLLSNFLR